jgi:hypothetical protein
MIGIDTPVAGSIAMTFDNRKKREHKRTICPWIYWNRYACLVKQIFVFLKTYFCKLSDYIVTFIVSFFHSEMTFDMTKKEHLFF